MFSSIPVNFAGAPLNCHIKFVEYAISRRKAIERNIKEPVAAWYIVASSND